MEINTQMTREYYYKYMAGSGNASKNASKGTETKDWRDMSDDEWDKLIDGIDKYIDDFKEDLEKLKELQIKASNEAAAVAPSGEKALAASNAALRVASNGFAAQVHTEDSKWLEENSWTYDLQTEDQSILAKAKMANERAADALSKTQELLLTGDTTVGITENEAAKECARASKDNDGEKTWTITAFGEDGIVCRECKGGVTKELWRIDYKNQGDYEKVWNFLDRFDKDADLKFAGSKSFWEDYIAGKIDENEILEQYK
ncbi:MAG: hypothetical protein ACI4D4_06435 [Lachnospira sp.]